MFGLYFAGEFGGILQAGKGAIQVSTLAVNTVLNSPTVSVVSNIAVSVSSLVVNTILQTPTIMKSIMLHPLALQVLVGVNVATITAILNYDVQTKISGSIRNVIPSSAISNLPPSGQINNEIVPRFKS